MTQAPILNVNDVILWLKVILTGAMLVFLFLRYRRAKTSAGPDKGHSLPTKATVILVVLLSFGVFHNLGEFRGGSFVHYGEMFHYYLGTKYFDELGYYDLYTAVIVADSEQGNELAGLPFYTDLKTYQNTGRETGLGDVDRIKGLFLEERWREFKSDVAFFKDKTRTPHAPGLFFLLMDHGYNGSPVSTLVLGILSNAFPVTQLPLLAFLDVLLVIAMSVMVFRVFGFEMGALFSVYFCVNVLNAYDFVFGGLLRYDWLFYIVVALCLLEKKRYASSAVLLSLSAMLRVFPAVMFFGIAVKILQGLKTTRTVERKHIRFVLAAGVAALVLFVLPGVYLGSVVQPWKEFFANTELHNAGVYVNHLGLRGIVLFEPSHLSLEDFVATFNTRYTNDIVRHWQDVKESEFRRKGWMIVVVSLLLVVGLAAIIWKRKESESLLWSLPLIYTTSFLGHYYYVFLCLFILLFFRRPNSLSAFVPLCLLMLLNIGVLVTDYFRPSPIVFYTLVNIYLFICMASILAFEGYTIFFNKAPLAVSVPVEPPRKVRREKKTSRRRRRP